MFNNRVLIETGFILLITVALGIFYNLSRQDSLSFIGRKSEVDYSQSDSLLITLRIQDSINRAADSISALSQTRQDSIMLLKHIQDSLNAAQQDSIKRIQDSINVAKKRIEDSLKTVNKDTVESFTRPVDIKLDFAKALYDKNYTFIDARDEPDYGAGHIQGAINVPYKKLDQFKSKLFSLPKENVYVVYCSQSCDVSIDLAYAMAKEGYPKVYIFHGGWDEWKGAGFPVN